MLVLVSVTIVLFVVTLVVVTVLVVDSVEIAGVGLTNDDVFSKLRGEKGSKVNIEVQRMGSKENIEFVITRDNIPINSLSSAYMINENTGYTKLIRFSRTTSDEFNNATAILLEKGMKNLIDALQIGLQIPGFGMLVCFLLVVLFFHP